MAEGTWVTRYRAALQYDGYASHLAKYTLKTLREVGILDSRAAAATAVDRYLDRCLVDELLPPSTVQMMRPWVERMVTATLQEALRPQD